MGYSQKVAVCIIGQDGKVYQDDPKGICKIPFGEYKIRVINKNDKRIGFDILINGDKVTKAGKIILGPHGKIDLERWLDFESCGDKLKFVPKDSEEAKAAGKTGEFEGAIEVRVHLEKEYPKVIEKIIREEHHHHHDHYHDYYPWWKPYYYPVWTTYSSNINCDSQGGSIGSSNITFSASAGGSFGDMKCCSSDVKPEVSMCYGNLSEGATIRGSHSGQAFSSTYVNLEEDYFSIKFYLMGFQQDKQMEFDFMQEKSGVKVSEKVIKYCPGCGLRYETGTDSNFCSNCGKKLKN